MRELLRYFIRRVRRDGVALQAASLSFTTILGLIPTLTVIVSVFAMVPAFGAIRGALSRFAGENFVPVFSDTVNLYVGNLVAHAGKMTVASVIVLFFITLLLVRSVDLSLNKIWRGGRRKLGAVIAVYWTLLTLGPLAVGIIIWIAYKVIAYALVSGQGVGIPLLVVYFIFPILVEITVIVAIFMIVPATTVRFQDALLGGVVVTVAFELSKKIFSAFVLDFSNYAALYGALAALPMLMIWVYINWWIVLLGAEFTATLGVVRSGISEDIPNFMIYLANITGNTMGADSITDRPPKRALINIKISKKA